MTDFLVPISLFALIFGIFYLRSRERLAMIDKGMNPEIDGARPKPFINLKWGLLLLGAGMGLLAAYLLVSFFFAEKPAGGGILNPIFLYFALIAIGGGSGLYISYRIEKREWMNHRS